MALSASGRSSNALTKPVISGLYRWEKELVAKYSNGQFGDAAGYEESLYVTESGKYFLYVNGGEDSIYPTENIKRMSAEKADEWRKAH